MRNLLLLAALLMVSFLPLRADHYSGAELTYECVGANGANFDYEVTLTVYRDCSGEILDEFYEVDYSSTCVAAAKLRLDAIGPLEEITPLCPGQVTRCQDATSPLAGRQRRIYQGTVTLPVCPNDYTFFWRRQFRNALALTNINSSGGFLNQPIFVRMTFNNSIKNCNSSYAFEDNIIFRKICAGEYFRFDFKSQITNRSADSLFFELTAPLTDNAGNQVVYEPGFTFSNPIATQGGFTFNGNTGVLEFTSANVVQSSILAIKVYEYDAAGNLIGTSMRDMQIIIEACTNDAPEILGINGTQDDTIYVCGGRTTCFNIPINDLNGDKFYLYPVFNQGITGLQILNLNNYTANGYFRFCFDPDTTGTYSFDLRVSDLHCPDTLEATRTITIVVPNDTVFQCQCASVNFNYDDVCLGSTTSFVGNPTFSLGTSVTNWSWNFGDGGTASTSSPTHSYTNPGTYNVSVSFTDNAGCTKTSTTSITICAPPEVDFVRLDSCQTSATTQTFVRFVDSTSSECSILSRLWDYGDGFSDASGAHAYLDSGWFNVQLIIGYGDANTTTVCYDSTDYDMYVYPRPEFTITPDDFLQSCDPTYDTLFTVSLVEPSNTIQWYVNGLLVSLEDGGQNDSVTISSEGLTISPSGFRNVAVRVEIRDSLGCVNDSIRMIFDPIKPRYLNTPYCEPGDTITFWDITDPVDPFSLIEYGFLDRIWDFNDPNDATSSNLQTTQHYYSVEAIYEAELWVYDNDSCFDIANRPLVKVVLPDETFRVYAQGDPTRSNDTICFNNQVIIFEGPNEIQATIDRYIWEFSDAGIDSVIVQNNYNGTWTLTRFGLNIGNSTTGLIGDQVIHRYDSSDYGIKPVHLRMVYNTIRNDLGTLVDSLYCVRHYYDTINLRPPHTLDWLVQKNCWYDTIQLNAQHTSGDTLTRWFIDWGDEGHGLDQLGQPYDIIYTLADTAEFGSVDDIYTEYQYTNFPLPDQGYRDINVTISDVYKCEVNFLIENDYRIMKLDSQEIIPLNFCDNQVIFFPPNGGLTPTGRSWNDRWNNIGTLHWDFGVPNVTSDTALLSMVDNFEDTVRFQFPDDTVYLITLTAIGNPAIGNNCRSVVTRELAIQPAPIADLAVPGISCVGSPIEFVDQSISRGIWTLNTSGQYDRIQDTLTQWILYLDGDTIHMNSGITVLNGDTIDTGNFLDGGYMYTYASSYYDTVVMIAISDAGCVSSDTIITYTAPYPIANFGCEPTLPGPTSEIIFTDSTNWIEDFIEHPDSSHYWTLTNDDGDVVLTQVGYDIDEVIFPVQQEDIYWMELIVRNEYNCRDTVRKEVDSFAYLDCPTAFSPTNTGDERNNAFRLHHKGFVSLIEYRIFNRYGEVVFEGADLEDEWDGIYKNKMQETGMYVVLVRAVDVLGREKQLYKNVLLVR